MLRWGPQCTPPRSIQDQHQRRHLVSEVAVRKPFLIVAWSPKRFLIVICRLPAHIHFLIALHLDHIIFFLCLPNYTSIPSYTSEPPPVFTCFHSPTATKIIPSACCLKTTPTHTHHPGPSSQLPKSLSGVCVCVWFLGNQARSAMCTSLGIVADS